MMIKIMIMLVTVIISIAGTSNALVNDRDINMIRVAFTNGFAEIIRLDTEQFHRLKSNTALLKRYVNERAIVYIKCVIALNEHKKDTDNSPNSFSPTWKTR